MDESRLEKRTIAPELENIYKLDDLLKGVIEDNLHDEVDFGQPGGEEA